MSVLLKSFKPRQILHLHKVLTAARGDSVRKGHWFPDYVPGPYPETPKEREEAAKKYNLLPEEYEPYPDDADGCGDYPRLPYVSVDAKDPWYPWDDPELRKDFNEPVPFEIVQLLPEGVSTDPNSAQSKSPFTFLKYISVVLTMVLLTCQVNRNLPVSEKQFPAEGVVHYTFNLEKEVPKKPRDPSCDED